ncbi:endonuclease/exonuclease/phosphatase family protein [Rhizobium sp. KVB221]|uniref:Endonuclease/exonuclease/phosphatase family protein n=1 Tax=Rhizobium setariae TaxID=2801340 RepID=A0A937CP75_9HYPH|nr:endonuclease/exonuclease/phosphatase family protein [Rhizobium setariae]MBL0372113.1 endonuclease/exonuclease/phosphatase family protein [Rhizobium setariae]
MRSRPNAAPIAKERASGELVVASYNIHKCVGTDGKRDPDRILQVIREMSPDIIALQEVDTRFGERKGLLNLQRIDHDCGLVPVPLSRASAAHGWHGNIVLVRKDMVSAVHEFRLPGLEPRGALLADIDFDDGPGVRIIAAHLGLLRRSRRQQADRLLDIMRRHTAKPTLLLGDFNEWRLGAQSSLSTFRTAFGSLPAAVASFPSRLPFLALDRIIADREGLIDAVSVHDSPLSRVASDHLPIKTTLRYQDAVLGAA